MPGEAAAAMRRRALLAAAGAVLARPAGAQGKFPDRPVRVIVALGPGGDGDLVARLVTQRMSETLGQNVVVENRPGAGSIVGHEAVARAAPDGYTLILGTISALTANVGLAE